MFTALPTTQQSVQLLVNCHQIYKDYLVGQQITSDEGACEKRIPKRELDIEELTHQTTF